MGTYTDKITVQLLGIFTRQRLSQETAKLSDKRVYTDSDSAGHCGQTPQFCITVCSSHSVVHLAKCWWTLGQWQVFTASCSLGRKCIWEKLQQNDLNPTIYSYITIIWQTFLSEVTYTKRIQTTQEKELDIIQHWECIPFKQITKSILGPLCGVFKIHSCGLTSESRRTKLDLFFRFHSSFPKYTLLFVRGYKIKRSETTVLKRMGYIQNSADEMISL